MAQFAADAFTGSDGTALATHNADWVQHPSYPSGGMQLASNRCRSSNSGFSLFYHVGAPATADYSVSADMFTKEVNGGTEGNFVCGRMSTSANTNYMARFSGGVGWQLYKAVAGTFTQLGSTVSQSLTDETTYQLKLEMIGTAIKLYKEGSATPSISTTDSAITAAGKAGMRSYGAFAPSDTQGMHYDNFSADDIGGGPAFVPRAPTMISQASNRASTY